MPYLDGERVSAADWHSAKDGPGSLGGPPHRVDDASVAWLGGTGHILAADGGGLLCSRCSQTWDGGAWQECAEDCYGSDDTNHAHQWVGAADPWRNVCATGDTTSPKQYRAG